MNKMAYGVMYLTLSFFGSAVVTHAMMMMMTHFLTLPLDTFKKNCAMRYSYLTIKNDRLNIAMYVKNCRLRVIKWLMLIHMWYAASRLIVWALIQTQVQAACLVVAKVTVCFVSRKSTGHTDESPYFSWKVMQSEHSWKTKLGMKSPLDDWRLVYRISG